MELLVFASMLALFLYINYQEKKRFEKEVELLKAKMLQPADEKTVKFSKDQENEQRKLREKMEDLNLQRLNMMTYNGLGDNVFTKERFENGEY